MKPTETQLFKRQITLEEIGEKGQQKLQNTSVLVVGCGGLGGLVGVYLALSGIGKLHLVDFDSVAVSNLHRQVFFELDDVGKSKAQVLSEFIKKRAPFTTVSFTDKAITKNNVFSLIESYNIIVDATDSLPTKYVLNDACVLKEKPLVYGSLYKFDGYVATFNLKEKENNYSTNLRDAFPKMVSDMPNCSEVGTLNSIVGIIASLQVNEVLKIATGIGKPLKNELLIYNSLENSQLKMKLKKSVSKAEIESIFKKENYFDANCEARNADWLITAETLKQEISKQATSKFIIITLIENVAINYPFPIDKRTTLSKIKNDEISFRKNQKYIFVCQKGNTSYKATKLMREKYPNMEFYSLVGGI